MQFSRAWRFLERAFPPSGTGPFHPRELVDAVFPTFDALGRGIIAGAEFRLASSAAALGAGTTNIIFTAAGVGRVHVPVRLAVLNPDAAARIVRVIIRNDGTAEAFGRWNTSDSVIDELEIAAGRYGVFSGIAVPPGNALQVTYLGMTGGEQCSGQSSFPRCPGGGAQRQRARRDRAALTCRPVCSFWC